jgi:hypothetical protein
MALGVIGFGASVASHGLVRGQCEFPGLRGHGGAASPQSRRVCISAGQRHFWLAQGERAVKPSAQPTLVRTQHLPHPAKTPASWMFLASGLFRVWAEACRTRPRNARQRGRAGHPRPPLPGRRARREPPRSGRPPDPCSARTRPVRAQHAAPVLDETAARRRQPVRRERPVQQQYGIPLTLVCVRDPCVPRVQTLYRRLRSARINRAI